MFSLNDSMRYLLYSEPTDMRKSYHTLSGLVTNNMGLNVRNGDVFIFINKARNRVKLLHLEQQQVSDKMNWLDLVMIIKGVNDDPSTRLRRLIRIKVRLVLAELRVAQTTI